jgi:hypothetical protein
VQLQGAIGVARFFWYLGPLITVAAPNRNFKLKKLQLCIEFPCIWLSHLKHGRGKLYIVIYDYFAVRFAAPWTVLPGTVVPLASSPSHASA